MLSGSVVRKNWMRVVGILISLLGLMCFVACGSSGNGPFTQNMGAVTITLKTNPTFPTVIPGGTIAITATVFDPSNKGVVWTLDPPTFGSLSSPTTAPGTAVASGTSSVTYTAPAAFSAPSTVTVTATSVTNPTAIATLPITAAPTTVLVALPLPFGQQGPAVPASDQTLNPGDQLLIESLVANAVDTGVTWSISPASGAGSLVDVVNGVVNYVAPSAVSVPVTATITATSTSSPSASGSTRITVLPSGGGPNVTVLHVDGGPVPGQIYQNGAFINGVTICNPGSPPPNFPVPVCQTVDGILVDTGSSGLRILQSAIPLLQLPKLTNGQGETLQNCYAFPDASYLWGPVAKADVYIGGEAASTYTSSSGVTNFIPLVVQVISSSNSAVPQGCSNRVAANLNTPQLLGANGILGVGPEPFDCTLAGINYCDGSFQPIPPNIYFACPKAGCGASDPPVLANTFQQVANPVKFLQGVSQTPQGVLINLPQVSGAEVSVTGTLTFATSLPGATIHTLDSQDHFTTVLNGEQLTSSFIDSGSNGYFFPSSLPPCNVNTQFFCPSSLTNFTATNQGATEGQSTINFSVDNADILFSAFPGYAAFGDLAGPSSTATCSSGSGPCTFQWGLPFFYGRPVFTKVDACSATTPSCPPLSRGYWAF